MSSTDENRPDEDTISGDSFTGVPEIVPSSGDWSVDDPGDDDEDSSPTSRQPAQAASTERLPAAEQLGFEPPPVPQRSEVLLADEPTGIVDIDTGDRDDDLNFASTEVVSSTGVVHEDGLTTGDGSARYRPQYRPRVRRVTRVIRHIDPWSTFKVGLLFSLFTYFVCLTSGVLLWRVADRTGTLDNVERWFTQFGWESFEFKGDEIFDNAWVIGLFLVVAGTGAMVLLATVFNLISDVIGGIRVTVLEEEVIERTRPPRRWSAAAVNGTNADLTSTEWSLDDEVPNDLRDQQPG